MCDCSSMHSIWKFADHIFVSTENGLSKHKLKIFFAILKPILKFFIKMESMAVYSLLFRALCLANVSKRIQLCAITWVSTAQHCLPCALLSADTVLIVCWWLGCCWVMGICLGPLYSEELLPLQHGAGGVALPAKLGCMRPAGWTYLC